jgi:hypothetical protein
MSHVTKQIVMVLQKYTYPLSMDDLTGDGWQYFSASCINEQSFMLYARLRKHVKHCIASLPYF